MMLMTMAALGFTLTGWAVAASVWVNGRRARHERDLLKDAYLTQMEQMTRVLQRLVGE